MYHHRHGHGYEETPTPIGSTPGSLGNICVKLTVCTTLVLLGGMFAGLTLGLMGLDEMHLRVLAEASDCPEEKRNAKKVLRLMDKGRYWVLVVLLLSNVITNETLPIFLEGAIGGGLPAILISTASIVIFGIIPQAVCVRYGLSIGAKAAPLVLVLMWLTAPISYPIARCLNYALGANTLHTYKKSQLKSFLHFHQTGVEPLIEAEIGILNGALELGDKFIETMMTPMKDVFQIDADAILDQEMLAYILSSGYSRIPVYDSNGSSGFMGLLLVKQLLKYDHLLNLPVRDLPLSILPEAPPYISCFQVLNYFRTGRAHLLLVNRTPGNPRGAIGIVTLEDIIEEIIAQEIVDETDIYEDNIHYRAAKRLATARIMHGIIECREQGETSPASSEPTLIDFEVTISKDVEEFSVVVEYSTTYETTTNTGIVVLS
ncbi:hypothetical protein BDP27DRAFT_62094 [Rhodocollybia butyracea]|uniref:DUF21-domain-containing protein n=1 Tax=Rhodocollybia butyracea TaxID=206335 RepID=A0A9P5PGN7_9AGAR|nr:hypothetical protein BDP27DRAFT_62094 [Rhodocollybia butyracea]